MTASSVSLVDAVDAVVRKHQQIAVCNSKVWLSCNLEPASAVVTDYCIAQWKIKHHSSLEAALEGPLTEGLLDLSLAVDQDEAIN